MKKIITRFNDLFPYISTIDYYRDKYNIPIPKEFDFSNKYISYSTNNITWIKLRLQDSSSWSEILTKILGVDIKIIRDYETQDKLISKLYIKFKEEYKLPYNYYKLIQEDKELYYYLNLRERNEYLNKWNLETTDIYTPFNQNEFIFYQKISTQNKYYDIKKFGHYFDNGCSCNLCFEKRKNIINDIKTNINFDIKKYKPIQDNNLSCASKILLKCFYGLPTSVDKIYNVS